MSQLEPADDIEACVFDAYGTLLDFSSAVRGDVQTLGNKAEKLTEIWRIKQLDYTWLRSLMRRHTDFWTVTGEALDFTLEALELEDPALRERLMEAYRILSPYPEVKGTLEALNDKNIKCAVLSNGSTKMLDDAFGSAGLKDHLNAILSIDEVGIFKPDPEVYLLATRKLEVAASKIAFFSSNGWDVHGASSFGFRTIWVNRTRQPKERLPAGPELVIDSLEPVGNWFAAR